LEISPRHFKVILGPDGKWKMVLGSRNNGGGVLLLYGTDDPQAMGGWHFLNILHTDNRDGMTVAECSGWQLLREYFLLQ
jgi:beta-fructofuranosidase